MSALRVPVSPTDHHIGSLTAPVVIVEYFDFQCPYCAAAAPVLKKIVEDFKSNVCFIARHFPMSSMHPVAKAAALASEAAGLQGKFWEMHTALFANQEFLGGNGIKVIAEELGLDMKKYLSDLKRTALEAKIQNDFKSGIRSGVNATPTLFINGRRYDGVPSYDALASFIQELMGDNRLTV